jgi:diguanylate cyclase (GGDEF) domain
VQRIEDHLEQTSTLPELIDQVTTELRSLLDIDALAIERRDGATATRFDHAHPDGIDAEPARAGPDQLLWALGDDGHERHLTAIIEHHAHDAPVEHDVLMLLKSATEHGRRAVVTRLDMLDANRAADGWRHDAQHDPLTGLWNRHALDHHLPIGTAVIMIDIDHFKRVNDTYGHDTGDIVLQRTARSLQDVIRMPDRAIRYGGEELLVLAALPPSTSDRDKLTSAAALGERIRQHLERIDLADIDPNLHVTASLGVTVVTSPEPIETAIHRADTALYQAKSAGRNRVATAPNLAGRL